MDGDVQPYRPHVKGRKRSTSEIIVEENECWRLKLLGYRDITIGEMVGLSRNAVAKRIKSAGEKYGKQSVETYREQIKQRYEVALLAVSAGVEAGNLDAIARWESINARIEKLTGATAPEQIEVQVTQVSEQEKALQDLLAQADRDRKLKEADLTAEIT